MGSIWNCTISKSQILYDNHIMYVINQPVPQIFIELLLNIID